MRVANRIDSRRVKRYFTIYMPTQPTLSGPDPGFSAALAAAEVGNFGLGIARIDELLKRPAEPNRSRLMKLKHSLLRPDSQAYLGTDLTILLITFADFQSKNRRRQFS